MPQMSPMWWLLMMIMFLIFKLIMNSMIYFTYFFKSKKPIIKNNCQLIWKW
nr:ATP synthase F0 subunit 8 [Subulatus sp.]